MKRQGLSHFPTSNIAIGPGSKQLIFSALSSITANVALPAPSWVSYGPQVEIAQRRKPSTVTCNVQSRWFPTSKQLDRHMTRQQASRDSVARRPTVLILNSPNNPTGQMMDALEMRELAEVARRWNMVVVSDEIYALTAHPSHEHVSFAKFYPEGTIVTSGLSKWCGAGGWRLGYMAIPERLSWMLPAVDTIASETFSAVAAPVQHAAVRAYQDDDELVNFRRLQARTLSAVAKYCYAALSKAGVSVLPAHGGFYMFLDFSRFSRRLVSDGVRSSRAMCKALLSDTGVALLPGSAFLRSKGEFTARFAFVDFDGEQALENIERYSDDDLDEFVERHCPRMAEGVAALATWLEPYQPKLPGVQPAATA
eukprot:TRINITY_DN7127_c0_g1_i4.p1 TRINITY_DN7127_c0_g1~~TRINITY_DN7127_c0_g1_i4.p1  ORF type:complete len:367 (+),score=57.41 TRINITY_DN7127_c0_g1_i4:573-1673(+)